MVFYGIKDGSRDSLEGIGDELERIRASVSAGQSPINAELFWLLYDNVKALEKEMKSLREAFRKEIAEVRCIIASGG